MRSTLVILLELATKLCLREHRWAEHLSNSTYAAKSTGSSPQTAALAASSESLKWSLNGFDNGERN